MYESDDAWRARREADWAHQDLRNAQSDLDRATYDLEVARGRAVINQLNRNSAGGGAYSTSPSYASGGGSILGYLFIWPFFFWREILFMSAIFIPAAVCSNSAYRSFFGHNLGFFSMSAWLIFGYLAAAALGFAAAKLLKLNLFRVGVLLSFLVPAILVLQVQTFASAGRAYAARKAPKLPATPDPSANPLITPAFVAATFAPETVIFESPLEKLQNAWKQELAQPEMSSRDHANPQYQQLWLNAYIAKNVPPGDLLPAPKPATPAGKSPLAFAYKGGTLNFDARVPNDPWGGWAAAVYRFAAKSSNGLITAYSYVFVYFFPSIAAYWRPVQGRKRVFWINLLSGWTVIGWFVALLAMIGSAREAVPARA